MLKYSNNGSTPSISIGSVKQKELVSHPKFEKRANSSFDITALTTTPFLGYNKLSSRNSSCSSISLYDTLLPLDIVKNVKIHCLVISTTRHICDLVFFVSSNITFKDLKILVIEKLNESNPHILKEGGFEIADHNNGKTLSYNIKLYYRSTGENYEGMELKIDEGKKEKLQINQFGVLREDILNTNSIRLTSKIFRMEGDDEVIMEGALNKQGGYSRRNWNIRWFVLTLRGLTYYKSAEKKVQKGFIPWSEILDFPVAVKRLKRQYCFALTTQHRTFLMEAVDIAERDKWLDAISNEISHVGNFSLDHYIKKMQASTVPCTISNETLNEEKRKDEDEALNVGAANLQEKVEKRGIDKFGIPNELNRKKGWLRENRPRIALPVIPGHSRDTAPSDSGFFFCSPTFLSISNCLEIFFIG